MLIYPHLVVHKLIQKEKRVTLSTYQDELERYLAKPENNSSSNQIERTNNLAQLVDRITASQITRLISESPLERYYLWS
jgi:hypothetical protein